MSWIETYQNIANLVVCGCVSTTLYAYYFIDESYLNIAIPIITIHFTSDLFLTNKPDLILHHIFGLSFIAYKYLIPVQPPDDTSTILVLYKTEISTLFYVFKLLLSKTKYKLLVSLNDILFFTTFFKYRIYDFYTILISNQSIYNISYNKYNYYYFILSAINGMFILNLYWFLIICKIVLKPVIKSFSQTTTDYMCHYITSYTMLIGLFIGTSVYLTDSINNRYLYDIFGLVLLSIGSYNYHKYAYTLINKEKEIVYTADETIQPFLQDVGSIHLRSFLAILTNYNFCNIVYISAGLHISFYLMNICHIYYLQRVHRITKNNSNYNLFILFQYSCLIIPCEFDIILICLNSIDSVYSIHGIYTSIFMFLLFIINPLYDLSHVVLHICLILNTYICSNCNVYTIHNELTYNIK